MAFPQMFTPGGVTKVKWFDSAVTIASYSAGPTRAQINAATELTDFNLSTVGGWATRANYTDFPLFRTSVAARISTGETFEDSEMVFGADLGGRSANNDIRTELTKGDTGHVLIMDGGDVAAFKADLFQVTVDSVTAVRAVGNVNSIRVAFSIQGTWPNLAVPALS